MTNEELNKMLSVSNESNAFNFTDDDVANTAQFVKIAHYGQTDKMGYPYYTHPFRVCKLLKERFGNSPFYTNGQVNFACILALLHDVCEDTKFGIDDVPAQIGVDGEKADSLKCALGYITHDKVNDSYAEYIRNIAECPMIYPVWVKFCDLLDNSSLDRIIVSNDSIFLTGEDTNRINKYLISIRVLRKRLNSDNCNSFKCDDKEIEMINFFRTPSERKRMENK